jgi:cell volume regulation protein A
MPLRQIACVGWVGLRGSVPIILATFPVLEGVPRGKEIFDLVFFVVVVNAVVPGWTVPWVSRKLGVGTDARPAPPALLEIQSSRPLASEVLSFLIEPASAVAGSRIADLPFPEDAAILLVVRGDEPIAARGATVLQAGDHVHLFCKPVDRAFIDLIFGREEES